MKSELAERSSFMMGMYTEQIGEEQSLRASSQQAPVTGGSRTVPRRRRRASAERGKRAGGAKQQQRGRRTSLPSNWEGSGTQIWEAGLRADGVNDETVPGLPERRPYGRLGHGSGWKKDTGLSMAQQWKAHQQNNELDKKLDARVAELRKNQGVMTELWDMRDQDSKSSMQMAKSLERQNQYLEKLERQMQDRIHEATSKASNCRWGCSSTNGWSNAA